jgi:hypothetical protein
MVALTLGIGNAQAGPKHHHRVTEAEVDADMAHLQAQFREQDEEAESFRQWQAEQQFESQQPGAYWDTWYAIRNVRCR